MEIDFKAEYDKSLEVAHAMMRAATSSTSEMSVATLLGAIAHVISFACTNPLTMKQCDDPHEVFEVWATLARSYIEDDMNHADKKKGRVQ